jgi:hypothetical protein
MKNIMNSKTLPLVALIFCATTILPLKVACGENGPVLYYTFDQHKGDTIKNHAGENHAGLSKNAVFVNIPQSGQALKIRAEPMKTGYVEIPNHASFNSPTFTVAAWINLRHGRNHSSIVCNHDWPDGRVRGFALRSSMNHHLNFTIGAGGWIIANSKTLLPANQWVHAAGSFDGTNVVVYFNGLQEGITPAKTNYTPSPIPVRIGHAAYKLEKDRKFNGKIDDVMYWNRALTKPEILAVYDRQKGAKPPPPTADDISRLIQQLGAKGFRARKAAHTELIDLGPTILPRVKQLLQTEDPEIFSRLKEIEKTLLNDLK